MLLLKKIKIKSDVTQKCFTRTRHPLSVVGLQFETRTVYSSLLIVLSTQSNSRLISVYILAVFVTSPDLIH